MKRILLSVPHMSGAELNYVKEAFASNWLSTVGPSINAFEREFSERLGCPAVALASGTAGLHLALQLAGVGPEDEVFCPTLTFVATANPIRYCGARPVFLDSDLSTWNLDPQVLSDALQTKAKSNRLPRAVVVVHLFGQCADMEPILEVCRRYEVLVIEDAAEALGADYRGTPAGALGDIGIFSFNGNKIITTSGGGMLVSHHAEWVEKARFWATQSRDPGISYEHSEIGYNYRLSNVLAAIGRGQLQVLDERVRQRRAIAFRYRDSFADLPGLSLMPQASYGLHTNWLSCFLIEPQTFGLSRDELMHRLDRSGIETRPVWKPMHLQALYQDCEVYGGSVAEHLFRHGICLPSSSNLSWQEQEYVIQQIRSSVGAPAVVPCLPPAEHGLSSKGISCAVHAPVPEYQSSY